MNIVFDPRFLAKSYTPSKLTDIAQYRLKIIEKIYLQILILIDLMRINWIENYLKKYT